MSWSSIKEKKSVEHSANWFYNYLVALKTVPFNSKDQASKVAAAKIIREVFDNSSSSRVHHQAVTCRVKVTSEFLQSGITEILFRLLYCLTWVPEDGTTFSCEISRPRQHEFYSYIPNNVTSPDENHFDRNALVSEKTECCSDPMKAYYINVSWLHYEYEYHLVSI